MFVAADVSESAIASLVACLGFHNRSRFSMNQARRPSERRSGHTCPTWGIKNAPSPDEPPMSDKYVRLTLFRLRELKFAANQVDY
jgi:hypothetical protein